MTKVKFEKKQNIDITSVYITRRYSFEEALGTIRKPYKSKSYMFMAHDSAKYNSGILKQIAEKLDEMNCRNG
jgi:hypothetical protein